GGVYVAAADLGNGDGPDVMTGAGAGGGPQVNVFSGASASLKSTFFAYDPNFTGGVRVDAINVPGRAGSVIVTSPGPGGGPQVRFFSGSTPLQSFWAYDTLFTGGVFVAGSSPRLKGGSLGLAAPFGAEAPLLDRLALFVPPDAAHTYGQFIPV